MGEHIEGGAAKAAVLAHRDELTAQNLAKFRRVNPGITTSVVDAGQKSWGGQVTFAMVPTLTRQANLEAMPALDLLVIDEAHHAVADSYRRIIDRALQRNPDCRIYGVTATPNRGDKVGLRQVTRTGDLWRCGEHRLLCGDATKLADVHRALGAGHLADMGFVDPPYNVAYEGGTAAKMTIANDALGGSFPEFLRPALANLLSVTKGACYVCMSSSEWPTLHRVWQEAGGKWSSTIIWAKNTFALGRADYHQQFEAMLYGWKVGAQHYWCGARDQGNVWHFDKPARNDLHPTMKPVALVERAIRNSSKPRDTVLDCFGGSGTTMIAAERTGRRAVLLEIDPAYADVIVRRWQETTDEAAVLEGDDRIFADVAAARGVVDHDVIQIAET